MKFGGGRLKRSEAGASAVELGVDGRQVGGFVVEVVVDGLEGAAELPGEAAKAAGRGAVGISEDETRLGGQEEEGNGFELVDAVARLLALGGVELEVKVLPFTEAAGIEGAEEFALEADEAGDLGGRAGLLDDGAGGEGDKAEGGEQGGSLAEGDVGGGTVAALGIIVHAGQVVDDEGGAVDEFDGGRGAKGEDVFLAAEAGDAESKEGAEALPLAEDSVLHGATEGAGGLAGVQQCGEVGFDGSAVSGEPANGRGLGERKGQC